MGLSDLIEGAKAWEQGLYTTILRSRASYMYNTPPRIEEKK
jgi:hypothetical protein